MYHFSNERIEFNGDGFIVAQHPDYTLFWAHWIETTQQGGQGAGGYRASAQAGFLFLVTGLPHKGLDSGQGGKRSPRVPRKTHDRGPSGGLGVPSHGFLSWTGLVTACCAIVGQDANLSDFTFATYKVVMSLISVSKLQDLK